MSADGARTHGSRTGASGIGTRLSASVTHPRISPLFIGPSSSSSGTFPRRYAGSARDRVGTTG